MRKFFVTLTASLLSCSAAFAFWPEAADSSFDLGVGYRRDRLKWEIGVDTVVPVDGVNIPINLSSKLEWRDLNIWQIGAKGKYVTCDNIYIRAYADYGWITDGKVTDGDFITVDTDPFSPGTDDTTEFARSRGKAKKGHVYDASIGIGYQFKLCDDSIALTPIVGYSWHGQHLNIRDGEDATTFTDTTTFTTFTDFSDLNSKYHTRWNGPWLGLDFDYRFMCDWSLFASYEYHWANYHASADWNLRADLPDGFHHRSHNAHGQIATLGIKYEFCECWTLGLTGQWQYFTARNGKDKALIAEAEAGDLEVDCYLSVPLKRVQWQSASITLDVGMAF